MNYSHLIKEFAIITGVYLLGEFLAKLLHNFVPGSVIGMIMLTVLLLTGLVKLEQVETATALLLDNLALFFVPAGVGLILYFDLIAAEFLAILSTTVVSTILVLGVTAKVIELSLKQKVKGTS